MIQASRVMDVPASALFDMLVESVVYDIKQSTGKTVRPSNFKKGTNYRKKIKTNAKGKKGVSVRVTVTELERPTLYEAKFEGGDGSFTTIRYEIEELGPEKIRVTYAEDYNEVGSMARPMRWLQKQTAKSNFKKTLAGMEKTVQEHMAAQKAEAEKD